MKHVLPVFFLLALFAPGLSRAQDFSTKGNDFWLCFPSHEPRTNVPFYPPRMSLYLTSDQNSSGTITVGSFSTSFTVTANQTTAAIDIPTDIANILYTEAGKVVKNKGIHVKVDEGKPGVVLYAYCYSTDARTSATLVLPTRLLGKKYFSINYIQPQIRRSTGETNQSSQFVIVATEANTTVRYQLRRNGVLDANATTVTFQEAGEVLQIQDHTYDPVSITTPDLTGSIIESISGSGGESCKNIAVFSGSSQCEIGAVIPGALRPYEFAPDPLFQQSYPVNTWGKHFGLVPFVSHTGVYHYRVLASENNTVVMIDGSAVTLQAGEFYPATPPGRLPVHVPVSKPIIISANKPIAVAQYMISAGINGYDFIQGDPDMVLLNPVEQNISDISVFSVKLKDFLHVVSRQYLNIFMSWQSSASFRINGSPPKAEFKRLPPPHDQYGYLIEDITTYGTSSFRLTADAGFNAISYGIGTTESYAYSAGTSMKDLTPSIVFQNAFKRVDAAITCVNSDLQFSVPLGFQPSGIKWDFSAAPNISPNTEINQGSAVYDSTGASNGLYYYGPKQTYRFSKANTAAMRDTIKLYTVSATPNGCGSTDQLFVFPVTVNDEVSAKFTIDNKGCVSDSVRFSTQGAAGQDILAWRWNYGDGATEDRTDGNSFARKYATGGNYPVSLQAISSVGCGSASMMQTIAISDRPLANFSYPEINCAEQDILFTDASGSSGSMIGKWIWNLDDGAGAFTNTTNASPKTRYAVHGIKNPVLQVETVTGCKSEPYSPARKLKVNPIPELGFILPEICLNDAIASFVDTSRIAEGSISMYAWNFNAAVPAVTPGPNPLTSTQKNPQVRYNKEAHYKVSLTASSDMGCVVSRTMDFTVNGSNPKAAFEMVGTAHCGTRPVQLKNNSTVDFGNVTRLEIYWDLLNKPGEKEVDESPFAGKLYPHSYPATVSTQADAYTIRLVAYSGGTSCVNTSTQIIQVYPQPRADFSVSALTLCSGDNIFFTDKSQGISSAAASWVWDLAKGDRSTLQHPQKRFRDSGMAVVSMHFTNADGCVSDTVSKTLTVYPNPKVVLPHNARVLAGDLITLVPQLIAGQGLRYLWTPPTYLVSDTALIAKAYPEEDTRYRLTLTTDKGCSASDTILVKVLKIPEVPNAFSPNGDGINDTWRIKYLGDYPGATAEVYNRYGEMVYKIVGYAEWNGTVFGKPLPIGTYYYIVNPKNGRNAMAGSVTIIR